MKNHDEDRDPAIEKLLADLTSEDSTGARPPAMQAALDRFRAELPEHPAAHISSAVPHANSRKKEIAALLIFDDVVALDAIGPYEALCRLNSIEMRVVGPRKGVVRCARGRLALVADYALEDVPRPDIVVIPGGPGVDPAMKDSRVIEWVRRAHETSRWTASVCTGSLILAAAGILEGLPATTHWASMDRLRDLGAVPTGDRIVRQGKVLTSAGVSAGIDMGIVLAQLLTDEETAQCIQLGMEYDPRPPFDCGTPDKAPARVLERVRRGLEAERRARAGT
jgi:putative intracellular protease/amidase